MLENLIFGSLGQQIIAALVVLVFSFATILRIYLICPLHANIKEYFTNHSASENDSYHYHSENYIDNGVIER